MSMTKQEYFENVKSMARKLFDEAVAEGLTEKDEIYDYFQETLPERADSHTFIVYNYRHLEVLQHTENRDAFFDVMGRMEADSTDEVFTQLAYWAFYQDIVDDFNDGMDSWMEFTFRPELEDAL